MKKTTDDLVFPTLSVCVSLCLSVFQEDSSHLQPQGRTHLEAFVALSGGSGSSGQNQSRRQFAKVLRLDDEAIVISLGDGRNFAEERAGVGRCQDDNSAWIQNEKERSTNRNTLHGNSQKKTTNTEGENISNRDGQNDKDRKIKQQKYRLTAGSKQTQKQRGTNGVRTTTNQ